MQRWKLAVVVVSAAVTLGGGAAAAKTSGQRDLKIVRVHFTPTAVVANDVGLVCDSANQCVSLTTLTATQTGDLQGSTAQSLTTSFNGTAAFPQTMSGTFTGNVNGCGTGGFLYRGVGSVDATTLRYTATYTLVRGSGTGDLAGITGVLTQEGSVADTTPAPISGVVRCRS